MSDIGSHSTRAGAEGDPGTSRARRPDGKHPATPLAGPYGHPVHPILVTVPIGAWVASFVFDLISRGDVEHQVFAKGAFWLILVGIVGAVLAALFGLMDLLTIPRGSPAFKTALTHMALNSAVLVLYVVNFVLRRDELTRAVGTPKRYIVLSAVLLAILGVSGYLGGKLSYRYGIRVADESTQREGLVARPSADG